MKSDTTMATQTAQPGAASASGRLGLSLVVIATAQLMLVLDDTVANIALPSIQRDLGVAASLLPWVISAYVLAFGSLLLFGGRVGDLFGRRRVLQIGLTVFTAASLVGGLAPTGELLVAARGFQGLGAALVAPNVLALIATTFAVGAPRNSAMAVYAAMSAVGITGGLLLGGILTGLLNWRWVFLINLPIGLAVLTGTRTLVEGARNTGRLDTPGAFTSTGAMLALAYGITQGGERGWGDPITLGAFLVAALLGGLFLVIQRRSAQPMLPLGLLGDRNRAGSYATVLFIGAGLMTTFYLLTLYMQQVLQFSPLTTGLASLPASAGIILSAGISSKLVARFAPRALAGPGLLLAALSMYWLSTLTVDSSYVGHIMPALFLTYFGLGMGFMPLTLTAVHGIAEERAGVAAAVLNAAQQIGAALGVALLATTATSAANERLPQAMKVLEEGLVTNNQSLMRTASAALTHGYSTAFLAGAGLLLLAAVLASITVTTRQTQRATEAAGTPSAV